MKSSIQKFKQKTYAYIAPPVKKDSFEATYKILKKNNVRSVLDIGCAAGDFLSFLPSSIEGTGVDISAELIGLARQRVQRHTISFLKKDILKSRERKKFDAVTIIGTLHTFLDFRPLLDRALKLSSNLIIVHSPFNDAPVDAQHFHREQQDKTYMCAYSIFAKKTIETYLKSKGKKFTWIPFEMSRTLVKNDEYPIRNYHITLSTGERYLTNGIGILFKEYLLVIRT